MPILEVIIMNDKMKITICGAGTLGGNLAENLARMGMGTLTVIDDDIVEDRNLANQPYHKNMLGKPKVKALSDLLFRGVGAKVIPINKRFTGGNGEKLLSGSQLVIDSFDNHESRKAVKEVCDRLKIPCIHAGISNDGYGEVIWNGKYKVPPDVGGDACEKPMNRSLSLLVVSVLTGAICGYGERMVRKSYSITIKDFCVTEMGE